MLKSLLKLASILDKSNLYSVADEVDVIAKIAAELTPEKEKEIDESIDKYFSDPDKLERDQIEKDYGLGIWADDYERMGLEPWQGHQHTYEGVPMGREEHFKQPERYQTVISEHAEMPMKIEDRDGIWEFLEVFDKPEGAAKGKYQAVYKFVPFKELERRKEREQIEPSLQQLLDIEDVEATEEPTDVTSVDEIKPAPDSHGGGVKLF